jgi:hypothetical protein
MAHALDNNDQANTLDITRIVKWAMSKKLHN